MGPVAADPVVTDTITVGKYPTAVAVTPDGTRAYVTNSVSDTVSVIDTATNTVDGTPIPTEDPIGVAVTPDGSRVYVTNEAIDKVTVFDTADNSILDTISVGTYPHGVAVTADGSRVYVTNANTAGTVSVISTASTLSWTQSR